MGLFDLEVNCLTKILFGALVVVSLVMVALQHFAGRWYLQIFRFLLLFSTIVPIRCDSRFSTTAVLQCLYIIGVIKELIYCFYLMQFACQPGYGKDGFQLDD